MRADVALMPRRWDQASAAAGWLEGRHDGLVEQLRQVMKAFDTLEELRVAELAQMTDFESRQYQTMVIDTIRNVRSYVGMMCIA